MAKSTRRPKRKPAWTVAGFKIKRPSPNFPLQPHASGKWVKKINGQPCYFGAWAKRVNGQLERIEGDGWQDALAKYNRQADALHAGRTPRAIEAELTVAELCNRFLSAKLARMESGELSPRSFAEYRQATDLIVSAFGKRRLVDDLASDDFESLRGTMAKRWGPARLGKFIQLIRSAFKYADDNGLIERPVRFGSSFDKPGKATMRKHKAASDKKLFTAGELKTILAELAGNDPPACQRDCKAPPVNLLNLPLRAAVLLGINCGLGNTDIANLQTTHLRLNLGNGWLDFPRPKSGLPRRCPLWPETVGAIQSALPARPKAKAPEDAKCVFINRAGRRMVKIGERSHQDYVSSQFRKVLRALNINHRRGLGFYSLRHTFATVALQAGDRDAVRFLMGHAAQDVLDHYDETGPDDDRLRAVVDRVHKWLLGK